MTHLFRWDGQHFGFISNGHIFSADSEYLGWVEEDDSVWGNDGRYLGELTEENYLLRNTSRMQPMMRMTRMTPISPMLPLSPMNRMGKMGRMGWVDALDEFRPEGD